jgi:hypothetical protein
LVRNRPCLRNLSLGGRVKIELISELLRQGSHQVEILSQGEVIERQFRFYPGLGESELFHPEIPVLYASAFPVRFLNAFWSSWSTLQLFKARHRRAPFDAIIIYNLKPPQVACADYAIKRLGLPVVLEYEDDQFLELSDGMSASRLSGYYLAQARRILGRLSGCLSGSPSLLAQAVGDIPRLVLCGVVGESVLKVGRNPPDSRRDRVVFSGTHSKAQGLEQLVKGWGLAQLAGWELHIAGHGSETARLKELAAQDRTIVFHGMLNREANAQMLGSGKISIVPYDVSQSRGFSFKTIECLAAGLHVITTPLVALEALDPEMTRGITYIQDNAPTTIAASLRQVIGARLYERTAIDVTVKRYGPTAVAKSLESFLHQVTARQLSSKTRSKNP